MYKDKNRIPKSSQIIQKFAKVILRNNKVESFVSCLLCNFCNHITEHITSTCVSRLVCTIVM